MASITQYWPSFLAFTGGRRSSSPVVPPPLTLFSTVSANSVPVPSFSTLSTSIGGRSPSTVAAAKKKYIEEGCHGAGNQKKASSKQVEELVKGERNIPVVLDFNAKCNRSLQKKNLPFFPIEATIDSTSAP